MFYQAYPTNLQFSYFSARQLRQRLRLIIETRRYRSMFEMPMPHSCRDIIWEFSRYVYPRKVPGGGVCRFGSLSGW